MFKNILWHWTRKKKNQCSSNRFKAYSHLRGTVDYRDTLSVQWARNRLLVKSTHTSACPIWVHGTTDTTIYLLRQLVLANKRKIKINIRPILIIVLYSSIFDLVAYVILLHGLMCFLISQGFYLYLYIGSMVFLLYMYAALVRDKSKSHSADTTIAESTYTNQIKYIYNIDRKLLSVQ